MNSPRAQTPSSDRTKAGWLGRASLAFAVALILAFASLWVFRLDMAKVAAGRILAQSGLRAAAFTIDRLDLFGLHVRDVALNDGAIMISELTLAYSPWKLASGMIDSVTALRPHVGVVATDAGITIGGVALSTQTAPAAPPMAATPAAASLWWRIASIKLIDADVSVDTPTGPMHAVFSTDLTVAGTDIQNAGLSLDISAPIGGGVRLLHVTAPTLALTSQNGGVKLAFAQAKIAPDDVPWILDDLGGEITWEPESVIAKFASGRLSNTQTPASVTPISITGDTTMRGPKIDFTLHAAASARGGPATLRIEAKGNHDRTSGRGSARVTSTPLTFEAKGLQPRDFLPVLGDMLPKLAGNASLGGAVSWRGSAIAPALILHLADVSVEPQGARLSKFHGDVTISGLTPLATPAGQSLRGVIEAGGLPPSQTSLDFQILATPALRVEALRMDFVGGEIFTSPFTVDPRNTDLETIIGFKQVDLAEFFKLVSVDGLSGSGKLDGQIPLQFTHDKIVVQDGTLTATGPGVLRLGTDILPKQITEAGESVTLALSALADFHYDTLAVALAGNVAGEGTITLKIQGRNPAVLEGQAFNLNIKLETNFDRLIDLALRSMQAAQELLRQTTGIMQR